MLYKLTFTLLVFIFCKIECKCRQSYMTFCDDLTDLKDNKVENWSELVVGQETADESQLRSLNYDSLQLDRFEKLTTLIIVRQVNDLKTNTFDIEPETSKLRYLQLYGNDIKRIRFSTFAAATLRKLSLVNNSIEYIHKEAFYNCEIETIDLSNNKLESIEPDVFTDDYLISNYTKEIIIRNNRLESIAPNSFPSSLRILNLDYNKISYLDHYAFKNLENLEELTLTHNKISSLPDIKNFNAIKIIDASYNTIVSFNIEHFNHLSQLEVLDFSHNRISYPLLFQKFNFPKRHPPLQISLAYNWLNHLIICNNSFRDHIVFFYGNPWNCQCWEKLERFMVQNNVRRNECDLKFFGNGQIPYCINYPKSNCEQAFYSEPNITKSELEEFIKMTEESQETVDCQLKPRPL